jgi:hypothetical protein
MTRRDWVLRMAAGLGLSLLPACSTLSQETAGPVSTVAPREARQAPPAQPLPPADMQPEPVRVAADPVRVSPYNPIPRSKAEITGSQGEESSYPPVGKELLPLPPTMPEALAAERSRQQVTVMQPTLAPAEPGNKPAPDPPLVWAMRCFMDKRPVEAMEALKRYDKTSQDLLLCMLPLAARLSEGGLQKATPRDMSNIVSELNRVADTLAPRAELVIDKMCFCRFLDSDKFGMFGVYEPLEEDHPFHAGERKRLYIELRNFTNERVSNGYQIRLKSHMEIRDYAGSIAWELGFPELRPDITKSPRHDFCDQFGFVVPPNKVPPGRYTLWLRVTDLPTGRTAARSLDFLVVPARNAGE